MSQISSLLRQLSSTSRLPACGIICTVETVDAKTRTIDCTPIDESAPLLGVNLNAGQESAVGITLFPRVGSYVLVGLLSDGNAGAVLLTDDVERVEVAIGKGGTKLVIDEQGVVLDGGKLGGAVKVEVLTRRLNAIERDLNQLRQQIAAWTPIPQDGGASLKAATATWTAQPLALTERTTLENPKLKH